FFSSRRRHTRCLSDWSSDVLLFRSLPSSVADWASGRVGRERDPDLIRADRGPGAGGGAGDGAGAEPGARGVVPGGVLLHDRLPRSEERRVGKVSRSRWWTREW